MLSRRFPAVQVIDNRSNLGYARGNNQAVNHSTGRYVLFLNPDTILLNSLDPLIGFMDSHPECGIAGGKVLNPDGSTQPTCRSFPSLALLPFGRESPLTQFLPGNPWSKKFLCTGIGYDTLHTVDAVAGVFMIARRELFCEVGGFDEDYFLFVEDIDLCYRIGERGWKVYYVPDTSVIHFGGRSTWQVKPKAIYQHHRGMYKFFSKHRALAWHERTILIAGLFLGWWAQLSLASVKRLGSAEIRAQKWNA
jgi:GT2 family glycosyltransferase